MDALITDIILVWLIDKLFFFCVFFFSDLQLLFVRAYILKSL